MDAHKDQAIKQKYSAALMSNQKWQKLYKVMAANGADFAGIEYRFTDTSNIHFGYAPSESQIWETAIDDPVTGARGPIEYKHIESILIPYSYSYQEYENAPRKTRRLNIKVFLEALEKVGRFPITETQQGIVIHGYKT